MIHFKITKQTYDTMLADLKRPHPYAYERVGFIFARKSIADESISILATEYSSIPAHHYINDPRVGARINSTALRNVMERARLSRECILHVHLHDDLWPLRFSKVDRISYNQMIPSFHNIGGSAVHGAMIFNSNEAAGLVWPSRTDSPLPINKISIVGYPLEIQKPGAGFLCMTTDMTDNLS